MTIQQQIEEQEKKLDKLLAEADFLQNKIDRFFGKEETKTEDFVFFEEMQSYLKQNHYNNWEIKNLFH